MGDLPPEDSRPTEDDLQKAESCLKGVQIEILSNPSKPLPSTIPPCPLTPSVVRQKYSEVIVHDKNTKQHAVPSKITIDKSCTSDRLKLLEKLKAYRDFSIYVL